MHYKRSLPLLCIAMYSFVHGQLYAATPITYTKPATREVAPSAVALPYLATRNTLPIAAEKLTSYTLQETLPLPLAKVREEEKVHETTESDVFTVPFYSQFSDISDPDWKKVGCGIASLAMLINFYEPKAVSVDTLLKEGITAGAYLSDAGWTHAGLIALSQKYGLTGQSKSLADESMDDAFRALKNATKSGPVMVSVHYTFEPTNPIPHLVVVSGIEDGRVYYNDPAEKSGNGSISIDKFKSAWKKRYIEIRPA